MRILEVMVARPIWATPTEKNPHKGRIRQISTGVVGSARDTGAPGDPIPEQVTVVIETVDGRYVALADTCRLMVGDVSIVGADA